MLFEEKNRYLKLFEYIKNSRYVLIVTNFNINEASIATALAFSNYFSENKIKHKLFNANKILPKRLDFLNNFSKITAVIPNFFDLVISIDCNSYLDFGVEIDENITHICITHTNSYNNFDTIGFFYENEIASAKIAFDFFKFNKVEFSKDVATSLYTAIFLNTKQFFNIENENSIFKDIDFLISSGANANLVAKELLQKDSLAKYRIIPKILDSLELHNGGEIATIYVLDLWFKQTGATIFDIKELNNMVLNIKIVKSVVFFKELQGAIEIEFYSKNSQIIEEIASHFNSKSCLGKFTHSVKNSNIFEVKKMILEEIL